LTGVCVCVTLQGYDHGYYFISTFIGDHIAHHAKFLNPWTCLQLTHCLAYRASFLSPQSLAMNSRFLSKTVICVM